MKPRGFRLEYSSAGLQGFGLASSSNFSVLITAAQLYSSEHHLDKSRIASLALTNERNLIGGISIAAQDVYPIVYGGVIKTITYPGTTNKRGENTPGRVEIVPVTVDPKWISNHVLLAYKPKSKPHQAHNIAKMVLEHKKAKTFISTVSRLATKATNAIRKMEASTLGELMMEYTSQFDSVTNGIYSSPVRKNLRKLKAEFKEAILGWKLPGAGNSKSLILVISSDAPVVELVKSLKRQDWVVSRVAVAEGILCDQEGTDEFRISAGHRIDFIGAGDFGQDTSVKLAGACCGAAIFPRSVVRVSTK